MSKSEKINWKLSNKNAVYQYNEAAWQVAQSLHGSCLLKLLPVAQLFAEVSEVCFILPALLLSLTVQRHAMQRTAFSWH